MTVYCSDRDLLIIEPGVFTGGAFRAQQLTAGTDGALAGTAFSSASADFLAAGITEGMVLCVHFGQVSEGLCFEVVAVNGAGALTVSVSRAELIAPAVQPAVQGQNLKWQIVSFAPQIARSSAALAERLAALAEASGARPTGLADSAHLRYVAANLTLTAIFAAASDAADDSDARWTKSRHYAARYAEQLQQLRLAYDFDGDGYAESTRALANVQLRRR